MHFKDCERVLLFIDEKKDDQGRMIKFLKKILDDRVNDQITAGEPITPFRK